MRKFIDKAVRQYTIWDWGWLKIALFSLCLLAGIDFAQVFIFGFIKLLFNIG